jgi:hypothetical protein
MITLEHGGNLEIGDFIAIAYAQGFTFGWFTGEGKTGTLQYCEYHWPKRNLNYYNACKLDDKYSCHLKANKEEFNKTWLAKSYILSWNDRVMKIENPESVFIKTDDLQTYLESRDILKTINII